MKKNTVNLVVVCLAVVCFVGLILWNNFTIHTQNEELYSQKLINLKVCQRSFFQQIEALLNGRVISFEEINSVYNGVSYAILDLNKDYIARVRAGEYEAENMIILDEETLYNFSDELYELYLAVIYNFYLKECPLEKEKSKIYFENKNFRLYEDVNLFCKTIETIN